jgi:type IV pilus assembly protein PilX
MGRGRRMLICASRRKRVGQMPARQRGVVLVVTLIVLVAMMLASVALVRAVDTVNTVAGNLAFREAATHSGDAGAEAAIAWLESQNGTGALFNHNYAMGYSATRIDPAAGQSWDAFWNSVLSGQSVTLNGGKPDAAGDIVSYTISRMCNAVGDPATVNTDCSKSEVAATNPGASGQGAGDVGLLYTTQYYYRITVRVVGPRNTISYVQVTIAM